VSCAAESRRGVGTLTIRGAEARGRARGAWRAGFDRRRGAALGVGEDAAAGTVVRSAVVGVAATVESGWGSDPVGTSDGAVTGESDTAAVEARGVGTSGVETGAAETGGVETAGVVTAGVVTGAVVTPPPIAPPMTIGGRAASPRSVTCTPESLMSTVLSPATVTGGAATVVVGSPGTSTTTSASAAATGTPASAARARPMETLLSATFSPSAMGAAKLTAVGE
jgi:hypothetical protein